MTAAERIAAASHLVELQRHTYTAAPAPLSRERVAAEVPIALVYNGISHAVMMATPLDLADFAIGFSLSEQIVERRAQIYDSVIVPLANSSVGALELRIEIAASCFARFKQQRRALTGNSGCGLCGVDSLQSFEVPLPQVSASAPVSKAALARAWQGLSAQQYLHGVTGSMHAAAWADVNGDIVCLREDVGRHNALDKLIGALALSPARAPGFAIMSSRASYELLQKAARADIGLLATVSAPTALAINIAERAGISLLGFVRERGFVVYAGAERWCTE
ncbi:MULTISPECIES: formate dehydrogenase accessory sulfurtransferase FdhD [unclassified Undibacterium]|uniref:formate dehydrogenase accessory sulfurtransferase FdhD n=2 Tax=Bacteria TaxID=2 RepID=UPI002AC90723|nr:MULTISPECIES: formate dehydrogenase accessory sulfurtransferase FdhD [unclassified Undibacterium]MEB0138298.1 formate dehydrogenase accessory sulfurtransferase FdhD [Undibacterium sp. CCC2.1]MEB0170784.1 formate dehydrogenase accessory sulfurtransferase FdhD [Undibacterium sp. CCC1.1]MEB0174673.1 formate dehydrogenase accessory sulfurtransferase FdhD [Undibacterium sp. CCC3.4]MEB0213870.1 formate dehydrogenase accessory sulfurtransferase FdhD [Undibacterium sp. 5I2]WPX42596.1 formate dehydr